MAVAQAASVLLDMRRRRWPLHHSLHKFVPVPSDIGFACVSFRSGILPVPFRIGLACSPYIVVLGNAPFGSPPRIALASPYFRKLFSLTTQKSLHLGASCLIERHASCPRRTTMSCTA